METAAVVEPALEPPPEARLLASTAMLPLLEVVSEVFPDRSDGVRSDTLGFAVEVAGTQLAAPPEGAPPLTETWRVVRLGLSRRAIDDQIEALVALPTPSLLPPMPLLPEGERLPLAIQPLGGLLPPPGPAHSSLTEELFLALVA